MKSLFTACVSVLLLAACSGPKTPVSQSGASSVSEDTTKLSGTWELNYISGPRIAFNGLYPDKKPFLSFNFQENQIGGNTSCNGFSSKFTIKSNAITFADPLKTMMFCEGGGEETFLNMLKKVNRYSVAADTLTFLIDDVAVMRFGIKN